jgi:hypothetical protein
MESGSLRSIVKIFEKVGAKCRKLRGREVYVCWRGDVSATISRDGITVTSPGEFRIWYSEFVTSDGVSDDALVRMIKEATRADRVQLDVPCNKLELTLHFSLDKAARAAEVLKELADMWIAATNIYGELRLIKNGEQVSTDEWLSTFY